MTNYNKKGIDKFGISRYEDSIESRWTARHTFSSELAISQQLDWILNIGSYNGWLEYRLISSGANNIIGLDVKVSNIKKAKKVATNANFIVASATNLPFKEEVFHLITMYEVIEHIPKGSEKDCLANCNRVLCSNGTLLLSTPFSTLSSNLLDPAWYFGHRHYGANNITAIGKKTGFMTERTDTRGGPYEEISVILLYVFKKFGLEIPFKNWFERQRQSEYIRKGSTTLFMKLSKSPQIIHQSRGMNKLHLLL